MRRTGTGNAATIVRMSSGLSPSSSVIQSGMAVSTPARPGPPSLRVADLVKSRPKPHVLLFAKAAVDATRGSFFVDLFRRVPATATTAAPPRVD